MKNKSGCVKDLKSSLPLIGMCQIITSPRHRLLLTLYPRTDASPLLLGKPFPMKIRGTLNVHTLKYVLQSIYLLDNFSTTYFI